MCSRGEEHLSQVDPEEFFENFRTVVDGLAKEGLLTIELLTHSDELRALARKQEDHARLATRTFPRTLPRAAEARDRLLPRVGDHRPSARVVASAAIQGERHVGEGAVVDFEVIRQLLG